MDELSYARIEEQLVQALPELTPGAANYWNREGASGSDCGPYIFFEDMFALYVQILLALPTSPRRDELLQRAFAFIERMLASSDVTVRDLAFIGLFEGRDDWIFARSRPFLGSETRAVLDQRWSGWRSLVDERVGKSEHRLLDGYQVRRLIADELRPDGVTLDRVPGRTYENGRQST